MAELNQKVADHEARLQRIEDKLFPKEKITNDEDRDKEEDLIGSTSEKVKKVLKTNSDKKPKEIFVKPLPRTNALGHDTGAAMPLPGQEGAPKADDTESKVGMSANPDDLEKLNENKPTEEPPKTITTDDEDLGEEGKKSEEDPLETGETAVDADVKARGSVDKPKNAPKTKAEKAAAKAAKKGK